MIAAREIPSRMILGVRTDATSYPEVAGVVTAWAGRGESRYVIANTVNGVMEAYDSPEVRSAMNGADLITADGMPLVWALRLLGLEGARRVYGPDLTLVVLESAAKRRIPVGFYGGTPETLAAFCRSARRRWPYLRIAYAWSPPFRPATPEEDQRMAGAVAASGARILFVGLGAPKQEQWMAHHRGRLPAVMLGVGAAFDFLSGAKRQAPRWMMRAGLEWLFRLAQEPRRLWGRYLRHNPRFVALFLAQWLGWLQFDSLAGSSGAGAHIGNRQA